jgi:hypothetical protein
MDGAGDWVDRLGGELGGDLRGSRVACACTCCAFPAAR